MIQSVLDVNSDLTPCLPADQSAADPSSPDPASPSSLARLSVSASFSGLSTEERFVLFAIQQSSDGLDESDLWFLANLKVAPTKKALAALQNLKLVERRSDEGVARYYTATLSSVPLFPGWRSWFADFCTEEPPQCEGDTLGTTFGTVQAVILLALLSGSRDAKLITRFTLLPRLFVDYVLEMIRLVEKWCSVGLHDLERVLNDTRDNHDEIRDCLHSIMERLWSIWWSAERDVEINRLRAGHQIGGHVDNWVDDCEYIRNIMCFDPGCPR
jgi:hypothetical protein